MAKKEQKKTKCPTAEKRNIRSEKLRLINKVFKSKVHTAACSFEKALQTQDKDQIQHALNTLYSMMDKGVKRGIYKRNRAARVKARANQKMIFQLS